MRIVRTQRAAVAAALILAAGIGCSSAEQNDAAVDSARDSVDVAAPPAGFGPASGTDTAAPLQVDTPSTGTPADSAARRDTTRDTTATR